MQGVHGDDSSDESSKNEQIKKTVVYGGAAVGKSPNVPGNPHLDGKPEMVDCADCMGRYSNGGVGCSPSRDRATRGSG